MANTSALYPENRCSIHLRGSVVNNIRNKNRLIQELIGVNTCQTCGIETANAKFCSRSCSGKSAPRPTATVTTAVCKQCEKTFDAKKWGKGVQRFCSRSCSVSHSNTHRRRARSTSTCHSCGTKIDGKDRKYCNYECMGKNATNSSIARFLNGQCTDNSVRGKSVKEHVLAQQGGTCALCPTTSEWMGKPLTMVLDHIDGDSENNNPENIRLVCPNCDSQLDTFKSRNKGKGRHSRRVRFASGRSY